MSKLLNTNQEAAAVTSQSSTVTSASASGDTGEPGLVWGHSAFIDTGWHGRWKVAYYH